MDDVLDPDAYHHHSDGDKEQPRNFRKRAQAGVPDEHVDVLRVPENDPDKK
jgi:hypothetical protein